jgi:hypothetical protein
MAWLTGLGNAKPFIFHHLLALGEFEMVLNQENNS